MFLELVGHLMKPDGELPGQLPDFQVFKAKVRSHKTHGAWRKGLTAYRMAPSANLPALSPPNLATNCENHTGTENPNPSAAAARYA